MRRLYVQVKRTTRISEGLGKIRLRPARFSGVDRVARAGPTAQACCYVCMSILSVVVLPVFSPCLVVQIIIV